MSYTATVKCPSCRARHLVSCDTAGLAQEVNPGPFRFRCDKCNADVDAVLPANARHDTIRVKRDREA